MMNDRQEKQRYLRQNILDRDYDAEEFMDFCQSYKGSMDIDSWTLEELQKIVQQFIASSSKTIQLNPFDYRATHQPSPAQLDHIDWDKAFDKDPSPPPNPINLNAADFDLLEMMGMAPSPKIQKSSSSLQTAQVPIPNDPNAILQKLNAKNNDFISAYNASALEQRQKGNINPSKPPISAINTLPETRPESSSPTAGSKGGRDEVYKTSVRCRTFANKSKLDGEYEVVVSGHQIVNTNPFVPNHVLFWITTNPLHVEVKRRLKDMEALRSLLRKLFPGTQIPFLERCARLSETEPNIIKKQKLFIESFLNSLLMNRDLRCKILDDFLLDTKTDSMKKYFKDFDKMDKPKGIEDLYRPQGKVEVEISPQHRKYIAQQQLYFDYLQPNLIKLKQLYDQLLLSFANSVKIIAQICQTYDGMKSSTHNINSVMPEEWKASVLEETFARVSEMHKQWGLSIKTQAKLVESEIRHMYRYEHANIETIRGVTNCADSIGEAYWKRADREQTQKQQYEYNKRLNEYKSGIDNASKSTAVLRHQLGYQQSNAVSEIMRYLLELSQKMKKKFKIFSVLQLNISTDLENNWKEFVAYAGQLQPLR